ncbi:hypothetical protein V5799_013152 [Amblyomma americanum]|uniref:Uncharacterized protein n=1 Tax=Amblyomma americanum TaxID=6943 RepID=A0AAQ4E6N7_AMBAM
MAFRFYSLIQIHCNYLCALPRVTLVHCSHSVLEDARLPEDSQPGQYVSPQGVAQSARGSCTHELMAGPHFLGYDHESLAAVIRTEISMATRTVLKAQNEVIISLFGPGEVDAEEPTQHSYPLMTVNDVEEVEKSLKNSEAARKQLRLLHDSVGVNYSLYRPKGKKALVSMELFNVIVESVRKNPNMYSASDMDVRSAVMAWLKNCQAHLNTTMKRTSRFQVDDWAAAELHFRLLQCRYSDSSKAVPA